MPFHQQKSRPAPIARRRGQREGVRLVMLVLLGSISTGYENRTAFAIGAIAASASFFLALGFGARLLAPLFDNGCAQLCCDCCLPGPGRLAAVPPPPPAFVPLPKEARFERFAILKVPSGALHQQTRVNTCSTCKDRRNAPKCLPRQAEGAANGSDPQWPPDDRPGFAGADDLSPGTPAFPLARRRRSENGSREIPAQGAPRRTG